MPAVRVHGPSDKRILLFPHCAALPCDTWLLPVERNEKEHVDLSMHEVDLIMYGGVIQGRASKGTPCAAASLCRLSGPFCSFS
jgi:hypothetical protein